jgi:hypothetical protein
MGDARETGERLLRLWNDHDPAWSDLFVENAELIGPGFKSSGSEAARVIYSPWQDAFPDTHARINDAHEDGDTVIQEAVFEGTHAGTFAIPEQPAIEATNNKVSLPYIYHYGAKWQGPAFRTLL